MPGGQSLIFALTSVEFLLSSIHHYNQLKIRPRPNNWFRRVLECPHTKCNPLAFVIENRPLQSMNALNFILPVRPFTHRLESVRFLLICEPVSPHSDLCDGINSRPTKQEIPPRLSMGTASLQDFLDTLATVLPL